MDRTKYIIITIISMMIISIFMCIKVFQNDVFYTIKVGESISKYGIDMIDHFSWHNLAYTYPHWLYDYFIYNLYKNLGFRGLYIFNILTYITIVIIFYFVNLYFNKRLSLVSIISLIFSIMIGSYVVVRAQSITYILFLLEILFIKKLLDTGKCKYGIFLLLISIIICNVHVAVWPLYFILYLPYIVEYIISKNKKINKILSKKLEIKKEKYIKLLFIFMIISVFTGLLTPLGMVPYTYFIKTMVGNSTSYILEHQNSFGNVIIMISIIFIFLLMLLFIFKSKNKIRIIDVFMLLGLSVMALSSERHFSLYILLGMISFTGMFSVYLENNRSNIINIIIDSKLLYFIVIIEIIIVSIIRFICYYNLDYIDQEKYPVDGVKYLNNNYNTKNIRIFNDYDFGSYLLFNDIKVFIDSRADLYTREFSGLDYDIFDDFVDISNKSNMDKLEKYNVNLIFIYRDSLLSNNISLNGDYDNVYQDKYFVIYEKREKIK